MLSDALVVRSYLSATMPATSVRHSVGTYSIRTPMSAASFSTASMS